MKNHILAVWFTIIMLAISGIFYGVALWGLNQKVKNIDSSITVLEARLKAVEQFDLTEEELIELRTRVNENASDLHDDVVVEVSVGIDVVHAKKCGLHLLVE